MVWPPPIPPRYLICVARMIPFCYRITLAHTRNANIKQITQTLRDNRKHYVCFSGDHPLRAAQRHYGAAEERHTPPPRTHEGYCADGLANEAHARKLRLPDARKNKVYHKDAPYKQSGVKQTCPLRFLPLFCLVWDICLDMMHIVLGILKRHIMELFTGRRMPAVVKPRKRNTRAENAALGKANDVLRSTVSGWTLSKVRPDFYLFAYCVLCLRL